MTNVIGVQNSGNVLYRELDKQNYRYGNVNLKGKADSFEKTTVKNDKAHNNKFDVSECAKNFIKGVFSPLSAVINHPFISIGMVAATAVACSLVPILAPVMTIGFGALSVFQVGKGVYNVAKNIKNKEYDKAEKSFNEVGQGTVGVALTALGLKKSAQVAKEAKVMSELGVTSLDKAQKAQIAAEVKAGSRLDALKEIGSLFTSKTGLKAVGAQFKPSNIAQRAKDMFSFLFKKEEVTKVKKEKMKFVDTTEGKRRAAMTTEEIQQEVEALYKEACDEYGIPEELRAKIEISHKQASHGGGYRSDIHTIEINENAYKEGYFDLPDVVKHETTHSSEAILRQRLPMEDKEKLVVDYLLDKIQNGDKDKILTGEAEFIQGTVKVEPPKMNAQMKADFSKLAQEKLYQRTQYTNDEFVSMVKPMVESNPEFIQCYDSVDDAVTALTNYAKNHSFRYRIAMENAAGFNTANVDTSLLTELTPEERLAAIKSFKEGIDCLESNAAAQGDIFGLNSDFNQYQFTPEEVLCQQKGNSFEISKLKTQLENLRATENYDIAEEARLLDQIRKCELTIEYKTKGMEMYRLQTEAFNHPENTELAAQVEAMKTELSHINSEIVDIQGKLNQTDISQLKAQGKDVMGIAMNNPTNEYTTYTELQRPELGTTVTMPYSTTTAADIIGDDIKKK